MGARDSRPPLTVKRWKRAEYERLVDLGVFEGDPVELIGGYLIVAEPQNSSHATALGAADDALRAVLPPGLIVRAQMPISLDDESAPEPDLAVVSGGRADSSLHFDRREKGSLYARARSPNTGSSTGSIGCWRSIANRSPIRARRTDGPIARCLGWRRPWS